MKIISRFRFRGHEDAGDDDVIQSISEFDNSRMMGRLGDKQEHTMHCNKG
jgi:hypothetical protein